MVMSPLQFVGRGVTARRGKPSAPPTKAYVSPKADAVKQAKLGPKQNKLIVELSLAAIDELENWVKECRGGLIDGTIRHDDADAALILFGKGLVADPDKAVAEIGEGLVMDAVKRTCGIAEPESP